MQAAGAVCEQHSPLGTGRGAGPWGAGAPTVGLAVPWACAAAPLAQHTTSLAQAKHTPAAVPTWAERCILLLFLLLTLLMAFYLNKTWPRAIRRWSHLQADPKVYK